MYIMCLAKVVLVGEGACLEEGRGRGQRRLCTGAPTLQAVTITMAVPTADTSLHFVNCKPQPAADTLTVAVHAASGGQSHSRNNAGLLSFS